MTRRGETELGSIERFLSAVQRADDRTLTEPESKRLVALAGIAVPAEQVVTSAADAVRAARRMGFPVVLKVVSRDVPHKTDVGGVQLDVRSTAAVRRAYDTIMARVRRAARHARIDGILVQRQMEGREVILGGTHDPQIGPVLVFGLGGTVVEVLGDVVFRVVPIDEREARQMIRDIRSAALLNGYRGGPAVSVDSVVRALMSLSGLMTAFPHVIREIEINPLLVTPEGAVAIDAMAVVAGDCRA
jgi:succinyl-CoA synthetase beta subunit